MALPTGTTVGCERSSRGWAGWRHPKIFNRSNAVIVVYKRISEIDNKKLNHQSLTESNKYRRKARVCAFESPSTGGVWGGPYFMFWSISFTETRRRWFASKKRKVTVPSLSMM